MRLRHASIFAFLSLGLLAFACSDGGNTTSTSTGGASTTTTGAGIGGEGGGHGGAGATGAGGEGGGLVTPGCDSGIVCGEGDCCAAGEECVSAKCLPACASQVRCGEMLDVCCDAGDVCLAKTCVKPGPTCLDWADCAEGEFCEPTLGHCLPNPGGDVICEHKPAVGPLTPTLEWSWTQSAILPKFNQVINMPVVVDLEKDGTPDVLIVTSTAFDATGGAYLRALDGKTGKEKWAVGAGVYQDEGKVSPRGTPAAADIDGDGFVEIVAPRAGGGLIAFEHDGAVKWLSHQKDGVALWSTPMNSPTVAIADLEGDGKPEIVAGGVIFENDGKLRADNGVYAGSNDGTYGAVSIIADLDGMGPQEVVTGQRAFRSDGTLYWDNKQIDGYPAIADLDLDGTPEIVVVAGGTVRVQAPTTGAVLASLKLPGEGKGGPPTIADFDADGLPEIASANGTAYSVVEYTATPTPTLSVKWSQTTQDQSSNVTGSSVFDFQGDGAAEVVYNDECYLRVYDGKDGTVLYEEPNSSGTIHEYPVIVDVDGDNNTEIVVAGNDFNHLSNATTCPYGQVGLRHGVFVYGDAGDNWVRTRRVWNQHAYHITNIGADGTLPTPEPASWIVPPGFNNYRQSSQGAGVFNAPDLQVSLDALLAPCPDQVTLRAFVQNQGSLGVAAGVPITFYRGDSAAAPVIGTAKTTTALLPGQYEIVTIDYAVQAGESKMTFFVVADADDKGAGTENECLEDNNTASLGGVTCPAVK